jgi:hypothetical protein
MCWHQWIYISGIDELCASAAIEQVFEKGTLLGQFSAVLLAFPYQFEGSPEDRETVSSKRQ